MEFGTIEREIYVEASPEVVFEVVSSPEHLQEWWPDEARYEPTPGSTGEIVFGDRGRRRERWCRSPSSTSQPPRTFSFRWTHPAGEVAARGQLAAGHLRADAVRRRDAAADDRDRLPRDGLGGRRPRAAVPASTSPAGTSSCRGWRRTSRRWGAAVSTAVAERVDDDLWSAIGDPTRRRMLDLLLVDGDGTATTLSEQLPVTRQAVAKHLGVLDRVGLVHGDAGGPGEALPGGRGPARPGGGPAGVGRVGLGRPAAADQADRRGDPAQQADAQRLTADAHDAAVTRRRRDEMVDILHRVGVKTPTPGEGVRRAHDGRRPRRLVDRRHEGERRASAACWSSGSHRSAASTWRSSSRGRPSGCAWRVVDGPEEWVGTTIDWDLRQDGDYTIVLFAHQGWKEPVEFMHHCSTKWGVVPDEPEVAGGDRRGRAGAAGRADQRLALRGEVRRPLSP